jgi:hypothetical protein
MKRDAIVELQCELPARCPAVKLSQEPFSPQEWSKAIDIVAWLAEQAGRVAERGSSENAMSEALSAAFGHMVAYFHCVAIDGELPHEALAKAVAGPMELTPAQRDFMSAASRTAGAAAV